MNIVLVLFNIWLLSAYPTSLFGRTAKAAVNTAIENIPEISQYGVKVFTEAAFEHPRNAHQALNKIGTSSGKEAAKNFWGSLRVSYDFAYGAASEFAKVAREKAEKAWKSLIAAISVASKKLLSKLSGFKTLAPSVEEVIEHTTLPVELVREMSYFERISAIYMGIADTLANIKGQATVIAAYISHKTAVQSAKVVVAVAGNQLTRATDLQIAENIAEEILKFKPKNVEIVRDFGKDFAQRAMKKPLAAVSLTLSAASGFIPSLILAYLKAFAGILQNTARLAAALPTKSIKSANNALKALYAKIRPPKHLLKRALDIPIPETSMKETVETLSVARELHKVLLELKKSYEQLQFIQNFNR